MKHRNASRAEFELLAGMLMDLATTEYLSSVELTPKLIVMGIVPGAGEPQYRFGKVPVAELMTGSAGIPGEVVVAALIEKLSSDPEVLVVGHVSEAWRAQYTKEAREKLGPTVHPEDDPNREEILMLSLHSAGSMALMTCPLVRDGRKTTVSKGELLFNPQASVSRPRRHTH